MVNHDQQGIETRGKREVSDKVAGDLLEGARHMGFDQGEQRNGGMHVQFVFDGIPDSSEFPQRQEDLVFHN